MAYTVAAPYAEVIASGGFELYYWIDAYYNGSAVTGAQDLRPVGGSITDTNAPGVRYSLSVDLAPAAGLYDLLKRPGTQLRVYASVTYLNRTSVTIPMGVYIVQDPKHVTGVGAVSVQADDKWAGIQRAKFVGPRNSTPGATVTQQIASLITEVYPSDTVSITATSTATVGTLTWDQDRAQAILDMATSIGARVYFDRNGGPVLADIPTTGGGSANWTADALDSSSGTMLGLTLGQPVTDVCNVVVASSSSASSQAFAPQVAWDSNSASPTYAGTDPFAHPETAGPFGISVKYIDTPTNTTASGALAAAQTELARSLALVQQASVEIAPNPAVDSYDLVDVRPPAESWGGSSQTTRYVVDTVTHPLTLDGGQGTQLEARSVSGG